MARGRRILVADDDTETRLLLKHFVEKYLPGAEVTAATSGRRALEIFRQARAEGRPFSFVLLDEMMPEMSGTEAAPVIRALDPRVPVAFLTAYPARARENAPAGMPVWLKPDDILEVASRIERMIAEAGG